ERRREIAKTYNAGLADVEEVKTPFGFESESRYDVFQNYVLRAEKRDELYKFLKENGVETLIKDSVANHMQEGLNLSHFNLPFSVQLAKEVISLPMYPELTDEQVNYAIECVKNFYNKK
ncbi:MAG: DegT/DnrJ/EryC1/StrS family aminotransferase, partial [Candidatus Staskawiczbacteria bacterium]|nr:DegT/DnrJ/EryC1/StrS family aminotransferase [Candidatus Staskawiczbacteria bacterium]